MEERRRKRTKPEVITRFDEFQLVANEIHIQFQQAGDDTFVMVPAEVAEPTLAGDAFKNPGELVGIKLVLPAQVNQAKLKIRRQSR